MACDALPSPGVNPFEGSPKCRCGKLGLGRRSRLLALERGKGRARSPGIRLGRGTSLLSYSDLQPKPTPSGLVHIRKHPWVLGQATGTLTHKTHHGLDSGVSHHLTPYSILCTSPRGPHRNGHFVPGLPHGSPEIVPVGVPRLLELITLDCQL